MRVLFIYPNDPMLNPPPVSIGILSAILHREGFVLELFDTTRYLTFSQTSDQAKEVNLQVRPFDFKERDVIAETTDPQKDLQDKIESFNPDLIAISILEPTYTQAKTLLDTIQQYATPVIAGGIFPTFAPDTVLSHPAVNMVCVGEGEAVLPEVCRRLDQGRDLSGTLNLWYKKGTAVIKNQVRPPVDLEGLPIPDYDLFEPERFYRPMAGKVYRTIPIETNRGCPFQCTYCNSPALARLYRDAVSGPFFRKKSMAKIHQEIEQLRTQYDIEYVYFTSDTFLSLVEREFDEFIDMYRTIGLPFWVQTRPETISRKRVMALKEVGCHRMSIGVEHGNYRFRRDVLRKNVQDEVIIKACNDIAEAGIPLTLNNIIGFPGETRELIFDTILLNRKLKYDTTNAYAFAPFKGTVLHDVCMREGLIAEDRSVRNLTIDAGLDMPQLSRKEIEGLRKTFALYARLPEEYWPEIEIAEGDDAAANRIFEKLRQLYISRYFR